MKSVSKQRSLDELKLWFGLNDIPVGFLKGRIKRLGTKSEPKGAMFTPTGNIKPQFYDKSFVTRAYKRRSIFSRVGKKGYPIREARVPIANRSNDT